MTSARMKTHEFTISHDAKMLHDHDVLMKINMNDVKTVIQKKNESTHADTHLMMEVFFGVLFLLF